MSVQSEEVWFSEGLRFTCTQCGDCCTGEPGYVWVDDEEIAALALAVGETVERFERKYVKRAHGDRSLREREDGSCVFYQSGVGCTVYADRPMQCRTWPFWKSNLRSPSTWQETCKKCLGSGQGRLFTTDEILAKSVVIEL
ncbi:MAG: YkgJ family cysteine cluster protein [Planctomycetota bacterium]